MVRTYVKVKGKGSKAVPVLGKITDFSHVIMSREDAIISSHTTIAQLHHNPHRHCCEVTYLCYKLSKKVYMYNCSSRSIAQYLST